MQLHLHPTRREALTASYKAIMRWSLETNPATILAQVSNFPESVLPLEYAPVYQKYAPVYPESRGSITTSPDGRLFAHEDLSPDVFWSEGPRVIEWRNWDDFSLVRKAVVPNTGVEISSLASSPDGRWLVIAPWNDRIFLLDWQTGEIMSRHFINGYVTTGLTFDPTSTFVAGFACHDNWGHCMLWRLDPAERFVSRPALEEWPTFELVPQDEVSGSMALSVVHWALDRTSLEWPSRDLADTVCQAAFSPDSRVVVFNPMNPCRRGIGLELVAYEVVSGKRLWCARRDEVNQGPFIFAPDGSALLVPMQGGEVLVYRIEDGSLMQQLPTHLNEPVQALAFDHDGRTLWLATEEALVQYQPQG